MSRNEDLVKLVLSTSSELGSLNSAVDYYPIGTLYQGMLERRIKISDIPVSNIFEMVKFIPKQGGYSVDELCDLGYVVGNLEQSRINGDLNLVIAYTQKLQKYGNVVSKVDPKKVFKEGSALYHFSKEIAKQVPWTKKHLPSLKKEKKYFGLFGAIINYFFSNEPFTLNVKQVTPELAKQNIEYPAKVELNLLADVCLNTFRAKKFYESLGNNSAQN